MANTPTISIVTVVFNDLDGLRKTRESVAAQTYGNFEWIVCDGASGDAMTEYLSSLGSQVRWVSKADKGIYDAMNCGVSMSTGGYVVFMNAGDTFHDSEVLVRVVKFLSGCTPVADVLFGGAMLSFPVSQRQVYRAPRVVERSIWHGLPANHQATFYRKELLDDIPYDLQYRLCGDYYLAAMLVRNGARAVYLNEPLATFEVGGQSYKQRNQLFVEPYRIQRDVLKLPFYSRLASATKRFVSMTGFVMLSQSIFRGRGR